MTLSSLLGCEGFGAEPLFAIGYMRTIMDGEQLPEVSKLFIDTAKKEGFYSDELIEKVAKTGTVKHKEVPIRWQSVFANANEISYNDHIEMVSALQPYVHSGISKTINMDSSATIKDVEEAYMKACFSGTIKGLTIYRDGSRDSAPITVGLDKKEKEKELISNEITPRTRPTTTHGITTQFKTGCGKMYLTLNQDDTGICETFAFTGAKGGCSGLTEGVSRLISLALRSGVSPQHIIDQLCSVECKVSIKKADAFGKSCPDAIGRALKKEIERTGPPMPASIEIEEWSLSSGCSSCENKDTCHDEEAATVEELTCPWCNSRLMQQEGCLSCNCGFSRCN